MPNYSFKTKTLFSPEGVGPTEDKGQECSKAKRGKLTSIAEQKYFSSTEKKQKKISIKQAMAYRTGCMSLNSAELMILLIDAV